MKPALRVVDPQQGELVLGGRNQIKVGAEESGGAFSFWLGTTPRGKGPPLHVHQREDETFYILDGEFEVVLAERTIRSGPGTCVFVPRYRPHTFRSAGPGAAGRALLLATPGDGMVSYFRAVGDADSETGEGMDLRQRLGTGYGLSFPGAGAALPPANGARPFFYAPLEARPAPARGEAAILPRLTAEQSGGVVVEEVWSGTGAEWSPAPRSGPGVAYVAEGEHDVQLNGDRRRVGPGSTVFLPAGQRCSWVARGRGVGRVLCYAAPAGPNAKLASRP